jgi:hypothetical protein
MHLHAGNAGLSFLIRAWFTTPTWAGAVSVVNQVRDVAELADGKYFFGGTLWWWSNCTDCEDTQQQRATDV